MGEIQIPCRPVWIPPRLYHDSDPKLQYKSCDYDHLHHDFRMGQNENLCYAAITQTTSAPTRIVEQDL